MNTTQTHNLLVTSHAIRRFAERVPALAHRSPRALRELLIQMASSSCLWGGAFNGDQMLFCELSHFQIASEPIVMVLRTSSEGQALITVLTESQARANLERSRGQAHKFNWHARRLQARRDREAREHRAEDMEGDRDAA